MTATAFSTTARPAKPRQTMPGFRFQPLRAARAVKKLIADKEDTILAFEVAQALSGNSLSSGYHRLLSTPEGGRQAYLAIEFADKLQDRDWVAQFAPGTVGAAYRDFIAPRGLSAYGLAEESRGLADVDIDAPHPVAWYARRLRDVHDIWHVLTGYGTDALGEGCVLAFTHAQVGNLGVALLATAVGHEFGKAKDGEPYARAIRQAWIHGRRTRWLPALDYETLFAQPLLSARAQLGIASPTIYLQIPSERREYFPDSSAVQGPALGFKTS
jgi:ubiquinone biosynthesis protein COQ4